MQINQFHWHIVDSQSFPLELPGFTDIAQKAAYSSSSVYSASDVADIVSYAGAVSQLCIRQKLPLLNEMFSAESM